MAVGYGDGRVLIGTTMVGRVAVTMVTAVPALTPRIRLDLAWTLGHVAGLGEGNPPKDYLLNISSALANRAVPFLIISSDSAMALRVAAFGTLSSSGKARNTKTRAGARASERGQCDGLAMRRCVPAGR